MRPFQVGALVPWVNTAMEEELPFLVGPSIGLHWSRLRPQMLPLNGHDPSYLKPMIDAIPGALSEFDGLRLDAIVFGCTSAEARYDMLVNQREGCEWFTALHSLIYATKSSGVHNVLLVAPYDPFTMAAEKAIVNREGINVIRDVFLPYEDEIRHIATAAIVESVQENFSPECDGVLLSCTAMYTIEAVAALSLLLPPGCLITSSNLALATRLNNACTFKQSKQGQQ